MDDLISVVIPVYNIEKYLERCLKTVTGQTYQNIQIILIDDGSADNSLQMCNQWKQKDERIEVYHQPNGGVSSARNLGIEKALGEWIIFVDGDDWIEPDMLKRMYDRAIETGADMAVCSFVLEDGEKSGISSVFKAEGIPQVISGKQAVESRLNRRDAYDVTNSPCNKLFRKKILDEHKLSFPVKRVMAEDMLFVIKAMLEVKRCVLLPDALYHYFIGRGGNSHSKKDSMKSVRDDIELRIIRTKYLYQKEQRYLGEWSQDDLLYTLLIKYASLAGRIPADDERLIYIKEMLKKHIKAKDTKTKMGVMLYRMSPRIFVREMKRMYRL